MKRFLMLVLLLIAYPLGLPAAERVADFPVQKLAGHTYVIHGPLGLPSNANRGFMNNPGFVITQSGVVVIDPGSSVESGRMVLRQIRTKTGKPVTHVLNTHIHGDHWLGNQAFTEANPDVIIMAHPNMIQQARAGGAARWIALMEQMTGGATTGTRAVVPSTAVRQGKQIEAGGLHFRIHAPPRAHSNTDIMIEVVEDKVLFLGDNVLNGRIGRMDDATFRGNLNACRVALAVNARHYVPGHGKSGDKRVVNPFCTYLDTLYKEVGRLYEEGLSDYEMKPLILPKLAAFKEWSGFDEQVGKHVSLAILELEQASFE